MTAATQADGGWSAVVEWARRHESAWTRDPQAEPLRWGIHHDDMPPWNRLLGAVVPRGPASGLVLLGGREVCAWGEPDRADLTFSVAKTYLALLAGVAVDRGLIADIDTPVAARVPGIGFDDARGRSITWRHLLQQRSEWEGTCFGVPDTVDRYRLLAWQTQQTQGQPTHRKGEARPLQAPGSFWEYNDVRINQLSLALTHVFGCALPEVFAEAITRPLGIPDEWRWTGYSTSTIELADGRRVEGVPGGSHWGGGIAISARAQARIAQMLIDGGSWQGTRVLSRAWIERMLEPCAIAPFYGMLVWLNGARRICKPAPESSWFALGAGSSIVWHDSALDLVAVVRWIDSAAFDGLAERILAALPAANPAKPRIAAGRNP